MEKFPQLNTERLILRKIQNQDIPKIVEYAGSINIAKSTLNIPHPEYNFLLEVVEEVAKASNGLDSDEQEVMDGFVHDLTKKFREDIDRING